jgi:hypothetical protein
LRWIVRSDNVAVATVSRLGTEQDDRGRE